MIRDLVLNATQHGTLSALHAELKRAESVLGAYFTGCCHAAGIESAQLVKIEADRVVIEIPEKPGE